MKRAIREYGTKERFGKNRYIKLELDGWKYWSMGWPVNQTILINRAKVGALDAAAVAQA